LIEEIKRQLSQVFEMKDLRELHYSLGREVLKEDGKILITQCKYTKELLKKINMYEFKAMPIPL